MPKYHSICLRRRLFFYVTIITKHFNIHTITLSFIRSILQLPWLCPQSGLYLLSVPIENLTLHGVFVPLQVSLPGTLPSWAMTPLAAPVHLSRLRPNWLQCRLNTRTKDVIASLQSLHGSHVETIVHGIHGAENALLKWMSPVSLLSNVSV